MTLGQDRTSSGTGLSWDFPLDNGQLAGRDQIFEPSRILLLRPVPGVCVGAARAASERLGIMTDSRAERIYSVLAAHPEGLPTPRIYDLSGEQIEPRHRAMADGRIKLAGVSPDVLASAAAQ